MLFAAILRSPKGGLGGYKGAIRVPESDV